MDLMLFKCRVEGMKIRAERGFIIIIKYIRNFQSSIKIGFQMGIGKSLIVISDTIILNVQKPSARFHFSAL